MFIEYKKNVEDSFKELQLLFDDEVSIRHNPKKWTKKEILGHLCDSAINNYYRFMHLQNTKVPFEIIEYKQRIWVDYADYQNRNWDDICSFWYLLNSSIITILHNSYNPNSSKSVVIEGELKTFEFLVEDYYVHMNHHLKQIFTNT